MFGSLRNNIGTARNSNGSHLHSHAYNRKQGNFKPEIPFQNNTRQAKNAEWTAFVKSKTCFFECKRVQMYYKSMRPFCVTFLILSVLLSCKNISTNTFFISYCQIIWFEWYLKKTFFLNYSRRKFVKLLIKKKMYLNPSRAKTVESAAR